MSAKSIAPLRQLVGSVDGGGAPVFPEQYAQNHTYDGGSNIATTWFTDGTNTWTKTYTYSSGNLTGESLWVKS